MTLAFILATVFIALVTIFIETKQDICVIRGFSGDQFCWKLYGALLMGILILVTSLAVLLYTIDWYSVLILPTLVGVYSIFHDCTMGIRLGKGPWHLGDTGWDAKVKEIFQGGFLWWFVAKAIWTGGAAFAYFNL